MPTLTKLLLLLPVGILFLSCEGYRCADGIVIDKSTNLPLDSVLIEVVTGEYTMYTDSTGEFDVCNSWGGCVPNCKDIMVRFSKNDYKTITITNPEREATIRLEK